MRWLEWIALISIAAVGVTTATAEARDVLLAAVVIIGLALICIYALTRFVVWASRR